MTHAQLLPPLKPLCSCGRPVRVLVPPYIDPETEQRENGLGRLYTTVFLCAANHQTETLSYAEDE